MQWNVTINSPGNLRCSISSTLDATNEDLDWLQIRCSCTTTDLQRCALMRNSIQGVEYFWDCSKHWKQDLVLNLDKILVILVLFNHLNCSCVIFLLQTPEKCYISPINLKCIGGLIILIATVSAVDNNIKFMQENVRGDSLPFLDYVVVIDWYIGWPILSADFCVFYVYRHWPMRPAAFADPASTGGSVLLETLQEMAEQKTDRVCGSISQSTVLPHLFLIFVKYCLLVLVLPHLFLFQYMFLF